MIPLENLSLVQIKDFVIVVVAILAFVVLIGNAIKTIKEWRKPNMTEQEWRRGVDAALSDYNKRIETLEEGHRVICRALMAMLSHEINGNSTDKLTKALADLNDYLINK